MRRLKDIVLIHNAGGQQSALHLALTGGVLCQVTDPADTWALVGSLIAVEDYDVCGLEVTYTDCVREWIPVDESTAHVPTAIGPRIARSVDQYDPDEREVTT